MVLSSLKRVPSYVATHGAKNAVLHATKAVRSAFRPTPDAPNLYEQQDWEVAVVLHGCRVDAFEKAADSYWFLPPMETRTSPATDTGNWGEKTFAEPTTPTQRTAYITSVPETQAFDPNFGLVERIPDSGQGAAPGYVTAEAITTWRENPDGIDKMIVHYFQPHPPFENASFNTDPEAPPVWERVRDGELSRDAVLDAYQKNLESVLDSIEVLVQNIDAERVVITSDHGIAFGEDGYWGVQADTPISALQEIPWSVTTGEDNETLVSVSDSAE